MLCVDRCRDMWELISFSAQSGLVQCPNRIAFSDIVCAATWNFTMSGKSHLQRRVVLHSFCSSRAVRTSLSEVCAFAERTSNNNNNNKHDNVYGAVIMAEPLREFTRFT